MRALSGDGPAPVAGEGVGRVATLTSFKSITTWSFPEMTGMVLLGGPLLVVIGCLFWVLSLSNEQARVNAEVWAKHGVRS
jgi:hypothetical protein